MQKRPRSAFTVVELLVVIAIISMLVAILLPAVGAAREAARNARCKNRLKNLAMATIAYQSRNQKLPGFLDSIQAIRNGKTEPRKVSWFVKLAADMDQAAIAEGWKSAPTGTGEVPTPYIASLICPSDPTVNENAPSLSYMANAGRGLVEDKNVNYQEYGVFLDATAPGNPSSSLDYVNERDGTSRTLLFAENIQLANPEIPAATRWDTPREDPSLNGDINFATVAPNKVSTVVVWNGGVPPSSIPPTVRNVNGDTDYKLLNKWSARPASFHSGAANVVFCGQNVSFLSDGINYVTYIQLMVPDDKGAMRKDKELQYDLSVPLAEGVIVN